MGDSSLQQQPEIAAKRPNRTVFVILGALFGVVVLVAVVMITVAARTTATPPQSESLVKMLETFPVPSSAHLLTPPTAGTQPPTAVQTWDSDLDLEHACDDWRQAFRQFVGNAAQRDVSGSVDPGLSCTLKGPHESAVVSLQVTKLPGAKSSITLELSEQPK